MREGLRWILWIAVSSAPQADESKESLPEQERVLRELVAHYKGRVVDVIVVPGHSRDYYTYAEFCEGVRRDKNLNTDAPGRMWTHWERRTFDVFACMDGSRFGRKASIVSEVVGRTYDAKAQIYSNKDGWIDPNNRRWYAAMIGMQSESEIAELVRRRKMGIKKRAQQGLPTGSHVAFGYKLIYLEDGEQKLILDETKRPLFDDLAALILEGVGSRKLEIELFHRFGYGENGQPYSQCKFSVLLRTPSVWGHSALNVAQTHRQREATWMWDENTSPPPGVTVYRNTHLPIYSGELARQIRAELERRQEVHRGRAVPLYARRYSGLLICAECTYNLVYVRPTPKPDQPRPIPLYEYYRCTSRHQRNIECKNTQGLHAKTLDAWFDSLLRYVIETRDLNAALERLNMETESQTDAETTVKYIESEIADLQVAIRRLISKQANAPAEVADLYDDEIKRRSARIATLQFQRVQLSARNDQNDRFEQTVDDLKALTIEKFWTLSEQKQNQFLHRLLGRKRVLVLNGKILKVVSSLKRREKSREGFDSD